MTLKFLILFRIEMTTFWLFFFTQCFDRIFFEFRRCRLPARQSYQPNVSSKSLILRIEQCVYGYKIVQPVQERHSFERHSRVHSQNLSEAWVPLISKPKSEDWAPLIFGGEWSQRVHSFKKPKNLWNFNPNPFFLRYAQNNM